MIPLSNELKVELNWFTSNDGEATLNSLADALWKYYSSQCSETDGNLLYRNQGAAQLAKWLKTLPKGLRNGSNGPSGIS